MALLFLIAVIALVLAIVGLARRAEMQRLIDDQQAGDRYVRDRLHELNRRVDQLSRELRDLRQWATDVAQQRRDEEAAADDEGPAPAEDGDEQAAEATAPDSTEEPPTADRDAADQQAEAEAEAEPEPEPVESVGEIPEKPAVPVVVTAAGPGAPDAGAGDDAPEAGPAGEAPPTPSLAEVLESRATAVSAPGAGATRAEATPDAGPTTRVAQVAGTIESQLWSRIAVWVGSVALTLAGVFLFKWAVDHGVLTEPVRVALGLLFGLTLLIVGDRLRPRQPGIARGVTASGIAVLYAALLAATNLYQLIPALAGFAGMSVVTVGAVVLSLRHGAFIALLGLVGGFLTPALIRSGQSPALLFAYLFLLQAGLLVITRQRAWAWLAGLTVSGGMLWVLLWIGLRWEPSHSAAIGPFLLATLAAVLAAVRPTSDGETRWGTTLRERALTWGALIAGTSLMCGLLAVSGFSDLEWLFLGLLVGGALAIGRLDPRYEGVAWLASAAAHAMVLVRLIDLRYLNPVTDLAHGPEALARVCLAFGLLLGVGSYVALFGARSRARWALLSVLSAQGFLLLAYWALWPLTGHGLVERTWTDWLPVDWGAICFAIAGATVLGLVPVVRTRAEPRRVDATDILASSALVLLTLAVWESLRFEWITVGWSAVVVAGAFVSWRLRCFGLRYASARLGFIVALRLLANPLIADYPLGESFLWNWMLHGYGIPVVCFAAAAWFIARDDRPVAHYFTVLAGAVGAVFVWLELRHWFHPGDLFAPHVSFGEWTATGVAWSLIALGCLVSGRRAKWVSLQWVGNALAGLLFAAALIGPLLIFNPLVAAPTTDHAFGWRVLYLLLPAGMLVALGVELRRQANGEVRGLGTALEMTTLALVALTLVLAVRFVFHDGQLRASRVPLSEWGAHVAVLMIEALVVLALSLRWPRPSLREGGRWLLGVATALLVVVPGLIRNPLWSVYESAGWPVGLDLLFIYGLPSALLAIACGLTGMLARIPVPEDDQRRSHGATSDDLPAILLFVGVFAVGLLHVLLVRALFHGRALGEQPVYLLEWGAIAPGLLVLALLLHRALSRLPLRHAHVGPTALGLIGVALLIVGPALTANPLFVPYGTAWFPRAVELGLIFGGGAWLTSRVHAHLPRTPKTLALRRAVALAGLVVLGLLPVLWVRLSFHGATGSTSQPTSLAEWGVLAGAEILLGSTLWLVAKLRDRADEAPSMLDAGGRWLTLGGLAVAVLLPALVRNPLVTGESVGTVPVINDLLVAYGLPALLATAIAWSLRGRVPRAAVGIGVTALLLGLLLVTLQVRQGFHGAVLAGAPITQSELNVYSLAWIVAGVLLLLATIAFRGQVTRWGSAAVMVIAVCKVFLIDMAELQDLLRVISFLGLGVSLLLLAWLYQKIRL